MWDGRAEDGQLRPRLTEVNLGGRGAALDRDRSVAARDLLGVLLDDGEPAVVERHHVMLADEDVDAVRLGEHDVGPASPDLERQV